jgi:phage portal protein BeeE
VSPAILGQLENSNRAAAYAAESNFARWTVNPKLYRLGVSMSEWLSPMFSTGKLKIWFDKLDPIDEELELKRTEQMLRYGQLTGNELRALYGRPPIAGNDDLIAMRELRQMVRDMSAHVRPMPRPNGNGRVIRG